MVVIEGLGPKFILSFCSKNFSMVDELNISAVLTRLVVVKRSFTWFFFSFDVEVENTARIQNVLADELSPIKSTLDLTGDNVMQVSQCSIAEGLKI